jgi:hypothetical protein
MPRRRRSRREEESQPESGSSVLWRATIVVLVLAAVYGLDTWGMRWLRAPWSYPTLGPTLTGAWEAPLRARQGAEYRLLLELAFRDTGVRVRDWDHTLVGRAMICTRTGDVYEYTVDGDANRSGNTISLSLTYPDPQRSALGNRLEGAWRGDTLSLTPYNNPFQPDGSFLLDRRVSSADPDDRFETAELHRADRADFLIACARLTR